jgi:hypothetical protein
MSEPDRQLVDRQSSGTGVLARLWWMLLGNVVLGFSILFVVEHKDGAFCTSDVVFWLTVASLVLVRYVDVRFLNGCTATDAPASIHHWVKYTTLLILCCGLLWVLAHVVKYLWLGPGR